MTHTMSTMMNNNTGYLALYIGPMYSGKTSKLRELYKQYTFCNVPTTVINFADDTRYTTQPMMSTHNKETVPCIMARSLMKAIPPGSEHASATVFLVNEGQFFEDIVEWTRLMVEPSHNKTIHICGLDGDFKRNKFGDWLDLIPMCDHIEKLTSICCDCVKTGSMTPAMFSHRVSSESEQRVIGSDNYIPLCRACYNNRMKPIVRGI